MKTLRWAIVIVAGVLLALAAVVVLPTLNRSNQESYAVVASWGRAGTRPGELREPIGVAVDDSGYVYVSDAGNDRIQKFTAGGELVAAWGESGTGSGELRRPMHIAWAADHRLYVAEYLNDRIQLFAADGAAIGMVSEDAASAGGRLDAPGGVAAEVARPTGHEAAPVPSLEKLWIADFYNHRVAVYSPRGSLLAESGRSGRLLPGRLHYPTDVALGPDGTVYVADAYNHRIQRFGPDGGVLAAWGGPFGLGIPGPWRGWFDVATGIAVDSRGDVYVADFYNNRIQKFGPDGAFRAEWGGAGSRAGDFDRPTDVAIGRDGRVYVVDYGNNRVQVFARRDTTDRRGR